MIIDPKHLSLEEIYNLLQPRDLLLAKVYPNHINCIILEIGSFDRLAEYFRLKILNLNSDRIFPIIYSIYISHINKNSWHIIQ